jgi:hypothetical protein
MARKNDKNPVSLVLMRNIVSGRLAICRLAGAGL